MVRQYCWGSHNRQWYLRQGAQRVRQLQLLRLEAQLDLAQGRVLLLAKIQDVCKETSKDVKKHVQSADGDGLVS